MYKVSDKMNDLLKTDSKESPRSLRANATLVNKGRAIDRMVTDVSRNPTANELISCRDEASLLSKVLDPVNKLLRFLPMDCNISLAISKTEYCVLVLLFR